MFELYLILAGVLSPADPGVLESVANRRAIYFDQVEDWRSYDTLVAVADCRLLGRDGWLISSEGIEPALVVDCEADVHKGQMEARRLMADVSRGVGGPGYLILR